MWTEFTWSETHNSDHTWENRAYVHIKFDHSSRLWSFTTFCLNVTYQGQFYYSYSQWWATQCNLENFITYTAGKISGVMWKVVFCVHKPYFLMTGDIR